MDYSNKVYVLISVFVSLIIGAVLISTIGDKVYEETTPYLRVNETITVASGTSRTANYPLDRQPYFFGNTTQDETANIGTGTNITLANGTIKTNLSNAKYNISYYYQTEDYVSGGTTQTILRLLVLFFALGILAAAIVVVYKMGLFDNLIK